LEDERQKLLQAYYASAVDVPTLKLEQERIGREVREAQKRLETAEADLAEWEGVIDIALRLASNCAGIYAGASKEVRRQFNRAVFDRLVVRNREIAEVQYREPFELVFDISEFEHSSMERETGLRPSSAKTSVEFTWRSAAIV
jgi:hypothetical protein